MNSIQDSHQDSASAIHEVQGSVPAPVASRAAESQHSHKDIGAEAGPRELGGLALGVGLTFVAAAFFWIGLYLPNQVALRTAVTSFGTFGLVWLLFRLRVFGKPHGGLIAVGAVALFAASVPLGERGLRKLDSLARAGFADEQGEGTRQASVQPQALPVPTVDAPEQRLAAPPVEDVARELIVPAPDPALGRVVRMTQDAEVTIAGRKYIIRTGSQFPLKELSDGKVTFLAGGQEVTIDADWVKFVGHSQEKPEDIAKLAMEELKRRYPKVWEKGTHENDVFVERTKELRVELPDFFANPRWPLEIAEQLAVQEGWKRADKNEDEDGAAPAPATTEGLTAPLPKRMPLPEEEQLAPK